MWGEALSLANQVTWDLVRQQAAANFLSGHGNGFIGPHPRSRYGQATQVVKAGKAGSGKGYQGKFSRTVKRRKRKTARKAKRKTKRKGKKKNKITLKDALIKGVTRNDEFNGSVNDPNCIYLGHAAICQGHVFDMIAECVVKKLFAKAGITISNMTAAVPDMTATLLDIFVRHYKEDEVFYGTHTFTSGTTTFKQIADQIAGDYEILAAGDDTDASVNIVKLKKVSLIFNHAAGVEQHMASLMYDDITVNVVSHSRMKVQNRSLSGADSGTERVDNNPLEGYIYDFGPGGPITRVDYLTPLTLWKGESGILKKGAGSFDAKSMAKEPPNARIFKNVKKSNKVILQPGEIKEGTIYYTKSMKFWPYIKYLRSEYTLNGAIELEYNVVPCTTQVLALEDCINISAGADIVVAFEVARRTGVFLTFKSSSVTQTEFLAHAVP